MATEWGLLWIHIIWAGAISVLCATLSWLKVRSVQTKMRGSKKSGRTKTDDNNQLDGSRRRLFRVALFSSFCLLSSLVCTLLTSVKLNCTLFETWSSKDTEAYAFNDGQSICSAQTVIFVQSPIGCRSDCAFNKEAFGILAPNSLLCAVTEDPQDSNDYSYCDCPCEDMVHVEKPSVAMLAWQHFAQSLVTCIVGLNLGLRFKTK